MDGVTGLISGFVHIVMLLGGLFVGAIILVVIMRRRSQLRGS